MAANPLKHSPGTYALIIALDHAHTVQVGRRGTFHFPAGLYFYAGSAIGPGGLAGRLGRHLRAAKQLHWHVDYVLQVARIVDVWTSEGTARRECEWARAAIQLPGAGIVVPRFGASDCRCAAHLVHLNTRPACDGFAVRVGDRVQSWK